MPIWIALALLACGGSAPEPKEPATTARNEITGVFVDHAGQPISQATVLACTSGYCQDAVTRSDGTFRFPMKRPVTVAIKSDGVSVGPARRGTALLPGVEAGAGPVDVGRIVAPDLPPPVRLPREGEPATAVALGDGLTVTLDRATLKPQVGVYLYEGSARKLPEDRHAAYAKVTPEPIVGVYVFEPFGTTSSAPVPVELTSGLPAGTKVHLRSLNAIDARVSEPVPGTADGAVVRTDPGAGIRELSYLVVTTAP